MPPMPAVPSSITDGQPATALLGAGRGSGLGRASTPAALQAAIAAAQQQLDQDAVTVRRSQAIAAQAAQQRAAAWFAQAQAAPGRPTTASTTP